MFVLVDTHTVRHITLDGGMLNTKSLVQSSSCHPALLSFYQIHTVSDHHTSATTPYVLVESECAVFVFLRNHQIPYVRYPIALRLA